MGKLKGRRQGQKAIDASRSVRLGCIFPVIEVCGLPPRVNEVGNTNAGISLDTLYPTLDLPFKKFVFSKIVFLLNYSWTRVSLCTTVRTKPVFTPNLNVKLIKVWTGRTFDGGLSVNIWRTFKFFRFFSQSKKLDKKSS